MGKIIKFLHLLYARTFSKRLNIRTCIKYDLTFVKNLYGDHIIWSGWSRSYWKDHKGRWYGCLTIVDKDLETYLKFRKLNIT
jgi:hypothetical protein